MFQHNFTLYSLHSHKKFLIFLETSYCCLPDNFILLPLAFTISYSYAPTMITPATYFTRPSNIYRPAVLSSIESLEIGALQGLLWLKSGNCAPMNENMSLVNNCNNDTTNTATEVAIDESTLTLHPKKKKKKINHKSTAAAEKKLRRTVTPENLPTFDDNDAPTTLHSEEDKDYINPIHTIIRKDIIEVFVDKSDKSTAGMVRSSFSSKVHPFYCKVHMHHHIARFISSWFK